MLGVLTGRVVFDQHIHSPVALVAPLLKRLRGLRLIDALHRGKEADRVAGFVALQVADHLQIEPCEPVQFALVLLQRFLHPVLAKAPNPGLVGLMNCSGVLRLGHRHNGYAFRAAPGTTAGIVNRLAHSRQALRDCLLFHCAIIADAAPSLQSAVAATAIDQRAALRYFVIMSETLWSERQKSTWRTKVGLAEMLKGGVIMDVTNAEQAKIAADAGAQAVMALERVPADIRAAGGVARMSDPRIIEDIQKTVTIPVMAKCRIGHFVEAQILEALGVDFIDESEVLTPADDRFHVDKQNFRVPFVCGCRDLGEALRRIGEGAAMIRTKGEAGTGDVVEAVRHLRTLCDGIRRLQLLPREELMAEAKELGAPYDLVVEVAQTGKLPVPNFSAGGVATPADAALMMQLGAEAVFVGSGIFKSEDPARRARAIVDSVAHYNDPEMLARLSYDLGPPMSGINVAGMLAEDRIAVRGW